MALPLFLAAGLYLLYGFGSKFNDWRVSYPQEPAAKPGLTVEIDNSSVE